VWSGWHVPVGRPSRTIERSTLGPPLDRSIRDAYTGPRVTQVVMAVDVGLPINPTGLEAQMMGGAMDGIAQALTASLHIQDGLPLEGPWDDYRYTRQWNVPTEFVCVIMPATTDHPGGAGELGCGVAQAAYAYAYADRRRPYRVPHQLPQAARLCAQSAKPSCRAPQLHPQISRPARHETDYTSEPARHRSARSTGGRQDHPARRKLMLTTLSGVPLSVTITA
jgi:isoquinoline 1-oxidoreductase beta subunit